MSTLLVDPVSLDLMKNPMILSDCGHSFDQSTITDLLQNNYKECPKYRVKIQNEAITNWRLKSLIEGLDEQGVRVVKVH